MVLHQETYANRRFGIGMPDFGGQPPHGKVVLWERELPKTFSGTEKTPCLCYVQTYIFNIIKQKVKSLMAARFAIRGVL